MSKKCDYKLPDKATVGIFHKAGINWNVKVSAADSKPTDNKIDAILKDFGKAVRKESKALKKAADQQRRSSMKTAKEAAIKRIVD